VTISGEEGVLNCQVTTATSLLRSVLIIIVGMLDWLYSHAHSVNGKGSWAEGGLDGLEVTAADWFRG